MSNALGGLLDRALNNFLISKRQGLNSIGQDGGPELSSGTLQLLGKLCATRFRSEANQPQSASQCRQDSIKEKSRNLGHASELRQIISRGKAKTDCNEITYPSSQLDRLAMALSDRQDQPPYACPVCDDRYYKKQFQIYCQTLL